MTAWITLVVASILTLALRAGPSFINKGVVVPVALQRANRFAAPALMGALASRSVATQVASTGGVPYPDINIRPPPNPKTAMALSMATIGRR